MTKKQKPQTVATPSTEAAQEVGTVAAKPLPSLNELMADFTKASNAHRQAQADIERIRRLMVNHPDVGYLKEVFQGATPTPVKRSNGQSNLGTAPATKRGRAAVAGTATMAEVVAWYNDNPGKSIDECGKELGKKVAGLGQAAVEAGQLVMVGKSNRTKTKYRPA